MKAVINVFILALLTLAIGCGGKKLKNDPVIPAVIANYPTVEFRACGKIYHGLGICYLEEGQEFKSIDFRVQGYYQGTGRFYSRDCGLDLTFTYKNSELVTVKIPSSTPVKSCAFNVTLSPEFPKEFKSDLAVYSIKGVLLVRLQNGNEKWVGETRRVTGSWKSFLNLDTYIESGNAEVHIRGCDIKYDKVLPFNSGKLKIELSEAVKKASRADCVLEGVAFIKGLEDLTFTVLVVQYATQLPDDPKWKDFGFGPLAIPVVEFSKDKINITAGDNVTVISVDGEYALKQSESFAFDKNKPHLIRLITIKGRTVLGYWDVISQEIKWNQ